MSLYPGMRNIMAPMRVDNNGNHVTDIIKDGCIIETVPTDKSQIRKPRISLLFDPNAEENVIEREKQEERSSKYSKEIKNG